MKLEGLVIPISFDTGLLLKGVGLITDLIEGAVQQTFDWAEGMDHLGDVTGMTAEQTAAWAFVTRKAGVDVDALANSTVILTKGLFDSEGKLSTTGKALEDFGVSVLDASGNVKDHATLMEDIATKYASFGTQQERVDFLTNLFGRSGANLVDVFDTLAQEGGIDAVEQKVKDLGLAIDPDQYEQFTRNLEELKLAGTGLAAQFVDDLMPAAESLLAWAKEFQGMSPQEIFARIGEIVQGIPDSLQNLFEGFDWGKFSQTLIDGINSIDWAGVGQWISKLRQTIDQGLIDMFKGVDWGGLFSSIGTAFVDFAAGLGGGDFEAFKAVWSSNWNAAKDIVATSVRIAQDTVLNWLRSIPGAISQYFAQAYANMKTWIDKMISALSNLSVNITGATSVGAAAGDGAPGNAAGGWAGGLTWVGENGPELVNLPAGSYVNHNQASSRMAQQGPVEAYIDYDALGRVIIRGLSEAMQRA